MHPVNGEEETFNDDFSESLAVTYCAKFMLILHEGILAPPKKSGAFEDFNAVSSPLLQHAVLETLKDKLDIDDEYCQSLLVAMQIPAICLTIWNNPILQNLAFDMISLLVENALSSQDCLVRIFVESKSTLASLFQLLATAPPPEDDQQEESSDIRSVVAHILGLLAETGLLTKAVERFKLKSVAISGLASACLTTEKSSVGNNQDELATSATLSSRCMECLVDLLKGGIDTETTQIRQEDAEAIARSLGKKICHMVMSRFLERAKLTEYVDDDDDICTSPDVTMLVAISQHPSALKIIAQLGGTSALCLVAGEGHIPALRVLLRNAEASVVLQAGGHSQVLKLMAGEMTTTTETRLAAMELLSKLSQEKQGPSLISEADDDCTEVINYALHCIGALEIELKEEKETLDTNEDDTHDTEEASTDDDEHDDCVVEEEEEVEEEDIEPNVEPVVVASAAVTRKKKKQQQEVGIESWIKPPPLPPSLHQEAKQSQKNAKDLTRNNFKQNDLEYETPLQYACLTFLSNLMSIPKCLNQLSTQKKLVPTLHKFSKTEDLRLPSLQFLQTLAPLASSHPDFDTDVLGGVFIETLVDQSRVTIDSKQAAIKGLAVTILDFNSKELQEKAMTAISSIIQSNVKKCAVQRSSSSSDQKQRALLAKLTYSLMMIVRQVVGATHLRSILESQDLMVSLVQLIEWRYDGRTIEQENQPKKSSKSKINKTSDTEQFLYWNGAVSQALSYLVTVFHRLSPDTVSKLLSTVLTIARPGKAPRKTTNFVISLQQVVQQQPPLDSSAVLAAQQILASLKGY